MIENNNFENKGMQKGEEMMNLVLLTGFLGAGKTTLMKAILDSYSKVKIGLIVNEFGKINIDGELLKKEGIEMSELSNGSIFCACIKDNFLASLIQMSMLDLEYVFIEASGLADPSNMTEILKAIEPKTLNKYNYKGAIAIVDCENFIDLADLLPALSNQIEYSSFAVLNKADLVDLDVINNVSDKIIEINPNISMCVTSYAKCDIKEMVRELTPVDKKAKESSNTISTKPKSFVLKGSSVYQLQNLEEFLGVVCKDAFRIKGFVKTEKGNKEVSVVGKHISISNWDEEIEESQIVIISAVGIKMMSIITSATKTYFDNSLYI
jgi:G3E family GTPase